MIDLYETHPDEERRVSTHKLAQHVISLDERLTHFETNFSEHLKDEEKRVASLQADVKTVNSKVDSILIVLHQINGGWKLMRVLAYLAGGVGSLSLIILAYVKYFGGGH